MKGIWTRLTVNVFAGILIATLFGASAHAFLTFEGEAHAIGTTTVDMTKQSCNPPNCDPTVQIPAGSPIIVDVTFRFFNENDLTSPTHLHGLLTNRLLMSADIGPITGLTNNFQLSGLGHNELDIIDDPAG